MTSCDTQSRASALISSTRSEVARRSTSVPPCGAMRSSDNALTPLTVRTSRCRDPANEPKPIFALPLPATHIVRFTVDRFGCRSSYHTRQETGHTSQNVKPLASSPAITSTHPNVNRTSFCSLVSNSFIACYCLEKLEMAAMLFYRTEHICVLLKKCCHFIKQTRFKFVIN